MKTTIQFLAILFTTICFSQSSVSTSDFEILNNTNWKGQLMYVNYGDGKEVVLPTTLKIEVKGNKVVFATGFSSEPEANSKETIKIKKNGMLFGNEKVTARAIADDGTITITTEYTGKDANRPATMFKSYVFNAKTVTITKEVLFDGESERFVRNRYSYTRI
ncbi:hypothetical protein [Spongiivirga citrea]|uniref:Lipocalin-like domain-containing protein n=1 Tax=Spongiivirga citrea TaxID=1481457 RepID=A0A6M0CM02_9FLAO|nr:hypothetical protein [Spongiivirga citrea]NER18966.1 hypothetical protein [Spongiivirga citrea]